MSQQLQQAVIDLQAQLSFQEDTIQALNQVVTSQDGLLLHLQKRLQMLEARVDGFANRASALPEVPPPHY